MKYTALIKALLFIIMSISAFVTIGQTAHRDLRSADMAYDKKDFGTAENLYRDAVVKEPSAQAKFNLGNSLYAQERYEEAAEEFQSAVNLSSDTFFRAMALYNKGNSHLQQGDLKESLEAYKKSLLLNPDDTDAKRNFMLALQQQQQQQQQQQEQDKDDQNKEEQNEEQNGQNDQSAPPNEEEQQQDDEQEEQQQNEEQKEQSSQPQEEQQEMNRETAEQLLQIIENSDSYVQKKIKKQNSTKQQGDKDW